MNLSKCEFGNTSLVYLGHIVGEGKLKIDTSKVKIILHWPKPNNVIEVRIFLGLARYNQRCVEGFSRIVGPLSNMKGKRVKFL